MVTFRSTDIRLAEDATAEIDGDLTIRGVTKPVRQTAPRGAASIRDRPPRPRGRDDDRPPRVRPQLADG